MIFATAVPTQGASGRFALDKSLQFMEEIDSEISQMKIQVNERARTVGYQFLKEFT